MEEYKSKNNWPDIYTYNFDNVVYRCIEETDISLEDRQMLFDQITKEFGLYCFMRSNHKCDDPRPAMYNNEGLWKGSPPMSNIRYTIIRHGFDFDDSETDLLCRSIHDKCCAAAQVRIEANRENYNSFDY